MYEYLYILYMCLNNSSLVFMEEYYIFLYTEYCFL